MSFYQEGGHFNNYVFAKKLMTWKALRSIQSNATDDLTNLYLDSSHID